MDIRTFYWDALSEQRPAKGLRRLMPGSRKFVHGNAGDQFNVDLLKWAYPAEEIENTDSGGHRLLLVGSVAHRALDGDIISGIGSKHPDLPAKDGKSVHVFGVRGPLTLKALERAGHDVSTLKFMGDPGLLIGKLYPDALHIAAEPNRVIFIPHYRERFQFRSNKRYEVLDIDATPRDIAIAIRRAEFVYTSSLHGLIWTHALGRPGCLVAPQTEEPLHKYEDYLLSVGQPFNVAPTLDVAVSSRKSSSPIDIARQIDSITLPTREALLKAGVIR